MRHQKTHDLIFWGVVFMINYLGLVTVDIAWLGIIHGILSVFFLLIFVWFYAKK